MPEAPPLAVQLYTLRNVRGSFEDLLRVVAEAGYSAVETVGTHGLAAGDMRAALATYNVRVVSSHVALDALENDLDATIGFAERVGNDTLVVPYVAAERRPADAAGWKRFGGMLGELGARLADHGIRLLYHNHDFEMVDVDGRAAIEWLLDAAEPQHLGFEPDLAWIVRGGREPVDLLDRYRGRCPRVHVKDVAAPGEYEGEGGWAAIGQGILEWERLLGAARLAGAEWLVVEHDRPKHPAENIRESYDYLIDNAGLWSPATGRAP